jgi:tetratricopeptide (TPR) repeat protein
MEHGRRGESTMSAGQIAVATSIPPTLSRRNGGVALDRAYQELCIRSWLDCGFRVLSVNHREEIPALAAAHPEVAFIPTDRDASAVSGRRTPYIADLLAALVHVDEPIVGIINSDIVFEPSNAWRSWLPQVARDAAVTGQRHDATSLVEGTFRKYYWGFDFFFFDRNSAQELLETPTPFAMGLAWWDYWLPATLSLKAKRVLTLERPTVAHLIHKDPSLDQSWRELAVSFAQSVSREAERSRRPLPPSIAEVLPLCRRLAEMPDWQWRNGRADMDISQIAVRYIPALTRETVNGPADPEQAVAPSVKGITPLSVFRRFSYRLAAGVALEAAKRLEREGRAAKAKEELLFALQRTPRDIDLLCASGEFSLRNGDVIGAADLFARALESDPEDRRAICNLAVALDRCNRRPEARGVLERALAKWPDLSEARQLLAQFR